MRGIAGGGGRAVSEWCPQSLIIAVDCLGVPNEIKDECVGAGQWPVDAARCALHDLVTLLLATLATRHAATPRRLLLAPPPLSPLSHLFYYTLHSTTVLHLALFSSTPSVRHTSPVTLSESDIVLQANSIKQTTIFFYCIQFYCP